MPKSCQCGVERRPCRIPVRKDGRCALASCRGERNLSKPPKSNMPVRLIERALVEDPFCSADCCRERHGVAA